MSQDETLGFSATPSPSPHLWAKDKDFRDDLRKDGSPLVFSLYL